MTSRIIPVEPFDYIVFGATGDLTRRKLIPALYHRFHDGQFDESCRIVGVSRGHLDPGEFQNFAAEAVTEFVSPDYRDEKTVARFVSILSYVAIDVTDPSGWDGLKPLLRDDEEVVRAFYLAVAPQLIGPICTHLKDNGYWRRDARVVVEKPIGHDLASSVAINDAVSAVFSEDQIYRIDHYLGKETVQNLLALRFGNILFEPVWDAAHIDHVQITVAEEVGAGERLYYDDSGALRDMVQNHLMQLLCLVAMEPPASDDADALRDEKLKVLRSLKPIAGEAVSRITVRGQYRGGATNGSTVPAYRDELPPERKASRTETFAALKVEIQNWRWSGTPFYLRTGKRLAKRVSEIVISYRSIPHSIFDHAEGAPRPNKLVIRLQPDEGVQLFLMVKDPGPGGMRLVEMPLNLSFAEAFEKRTPEAYERLLLDVVRGNQTLFMRRDELEEAWRWIDPIRAAWDRAAEPPQPYMAGGWGPTGSVALIERDGRTWHESEH